MADSIQTEALGSDTYLITLVGSISFSNNQALQKELEKVLSEEPKRLLIDMSQVHFCNSQGFGDMLRAYTRLSRDGGHFGMIGPTPEIRKVLEITKFAKIIEIHATREEALG